MHIYFLQLALIYMFPERSQEMVGVAGDGDVGFRIRFAQGSQI